MYTQLSHTDRHVFSSRDTRKMKGQLLKDIAALTTFGGGRAGAEVGEDGDYFNDGTNAAREDDMDGGQGGEGGGEWRVEGDGGGLVVKPSRSRLRMERGMDFGEEEARYQGKKVSRKALMQAADDESEEESEEESEDEEESEGSEVEEDDGDDDDDDEEAGSTSSASSSSDAESEGSEEEPTLEEEMETLRKDKIGMALLLKRSREEQRHKAEEARHHRDMWNKLLEVRILLQRLLGMANRFPRGQVYEQYCGAEDETGQQTKAEFQGAAKGLRGILANLVSMRAEDAMGLHAAAGAQGQGEGQRDATQRRKKRQRLHEAFVVGKDALGSAQDPWVASQDDYQTCRQHWRQVVDAAHQRATLSLAVSKKFRVVNQGLWHQIEAASATRALTRSHLTRAQAKEAGLFVGKGESSNKEGENKTKRSSQDAGVEDEGAEGDQVDLEAFDDSELYQQLLRDYIQAVGPSGGMDTAAVAALGKSFAKRNKKKIDTKASKGRKLRYAVHPKLEHFMFPVPLPPCNMDVDRLFASLSGARKKKQ